MWSHLHAPSLTINNILISIIIIIIIISIVIVIIVIVIIIIVVIIVIIVIVIGIVIIIIIATSLARGLISKLRFCMGGVAKIAYRWPQHRPKMASRWPNKWRQGGPKIKVAQK